ncbi:hypothetical protein FJZ19_05550 [Candidatus Pacearchaeota archaeon]|nr:hypothetical protein [Candidatus Pacearchaeota archaeon]
MGEYNLSEEEMARYGASDPPWWYEDFRVCYWEKGERGEGIFRFVARSFCSMLVNGLEGFILGCFIGMPFANPVPPNEISGKIMITSTCMGVGYGLLKRPALMIYQAIKNRNKR